jgi:hypothetical protein
MAILSERCALKIENKAERLPHRRRRFTSRKRTFEYRA